MAAKKTLPMYVTPVVSPEELEQYDNQGYEVIPGTLYQDGARTRCIMRLRLETTLQVNVLNFESEEG